MTQKAQLGHGVDDIDNPDRVKVLGIIDQFRELGVNEDISLPQLVVVGDQSSGKSSLLEGLTGLSFPIASDLCTRFATQIVLRRAPDEESSIKVSIIPGPTANGDEAEKQKLSKFGRSIQGHDLRSEDFASVLDEAAVYMGLPSAKDTNLENLEKRFSDDILKIELCGPQHHHLSVVDVPGLFHNPTKFQTQEDLDIIRALIESYIVDPRTIILAVMDARNNLANQEVFRMARSADPQGLRTVGIITKCDTLQPGDEQGVFNIAQNIVERLTHGWFAVKNRSTKDIQNGVTIAQRHINESQFFNSPPWNGLPKDRVGIASLKQFLGVLLYNHIRGEFPKLVQEIRNLVASSRETLDSLGPPRRNPLEQRQFLTRLAGRYQQAVADSLMGKYSSTWESQDPRKLRMHIQVMNEAFASKITKNGHTRAFRNVDNEVDKEYHRADEKESIYDWIRKLYRESRGSELPGTVNPIVLEGMFRQQSMRWKDIAVQHMADIDTIISSFNGVLFGEIIPEDSLRRKFETHNIVPSRKARDDANSQLHLILADEMGGILQTVNHYFADTLAATREERVLKRLQAVGLADGYHQNIDLKKITRAAHLSNEDQAVNDIHDILKAYYRVALKRFTDNIVLQVVERCYLGTHGPVKSLSPEYVGSLEDADLSNIAAENYATASTRTEISSKLVRLERALQIAEGERI